MGAVRPWVAVVAWGATCGAKALGSPRGERVARKRGSDDKQLLQETRARDAMVYSGEL